VTRAAEAARNRDHAAALIGTLVAAGVRHAVLSPGARNTPIVLALDALARTDCGLTLHSILDERAAAFFALGLARVTGAPTLLSCTSGSAGAHYLPAMIEAFHAHIPLIAMTADRPPELQDRGAPQTIDQRNLFGVHVRRSVMLPPPTDDLDGVRQYALEAMRAALGAAAGPVHINVQYRKPLWHPDAPARVDMPAIAGIDRPVLHLPQTETADLVERISGAARGVFVWGPDPDPGLDGTAVADLAAHLGWPVLADPTCPLRFRGHRSGLTLTAHDSFLRAPDIARSLAPDLVIQLGGTPSSSALRALVGAAPDVIAIDPRGVWRDPEHSLLTLLSADPGPVAEAVQKALPARERGEWLECWQGHERRGRAALAQACGSGWWAGRIVTTLLGSLPEGALLSVASSMPIRDVDSFGGPQARRLQVMGNRGVNGIDGTIATTLGLSRGWTQGPTAALMGDLAFLHDHGSLLLARGLDRPVVLLVADNSGGGIFTHLPIAEQHSAFEPWFLTPQQADIPALCAAAGARCATIQSGQALKRALPMALESAGLTVLHCPIDRAEDLDRHRAAWAAAQGR
jgi:2-succinyl-5-enolpyruvyl-6-hydroxy-3-cyclohexene-1-carboxylate synthase